MNKELISIIVPIYNVESYLPKCIDSIINQTYKNLEIILVDDGSTDSSSTTCDNYREKDNRIIVIHQDNQGLSCARNKGLDSATGKYIVFVDADDYIDAEMVDYLYKDIVNNNADISICNFKYIYNNKITKNNKLRNKKIIIKGDKKYYYLHNKYSLLSTLPWNKIYKKELFDDIRYPKSKQHEDNLISLSLFKKANIISYNLKPLYNYVKREGSITSTFNIKMFDALDSYEERKKYYKEINNKKLLALNEYYKYYVNYNILKKYINSNNKELTKEKINNMIIDNKSISKMLILSIHIDIKKKLNILLILFKLNRYKKRIYKYE